ncbi:MAG: hypothetical protein WBM13_00025 [Bacteroidia bacterium]
MTSLQKELQEQGISEFQIWNGIIDSEITERGISKAHKQIIQYAKDNCLPEVLIGEDDLHFTGKNAFKFFLANVPSDYDIYLGGIYYGRLKSDNTVEDFSGLTLYMVNERFYDTFLSVSENVHLDRALRNKGRFVVCNPLVVVQHNGFSDNVKEEVNYDSFLIERKLFSN